MNLKRVALFLALLTVSACATTDQGGATPAGGHRRGSISAPSQWRAPLNPVTGNSQTIVVWDGSGAGARQVVDRVVVSCFFDQAVTVLYQVRHNGSVTWRTLNGNGSGDAVAASTPTVIDYLVLGYDSRIEVVTGGTGPTVSEIDIGIVYDRPLAM